MRLPWLLGLTGLALATVACQSPEGSKADAAQIETLFVGATLYDGSGEPGVIRAVGITGEEIVYVGDPAGTTASEVIDISGLAIAPGFIDVHNHSVPPILEPSKKLNEGFVRQGVTTVFAGPDGSMTPNHLTQIKAALDEQGAGTNVAAYVGHNPIRTEVMGDEQKKKSPTTEQLDAMRAQVRAGMELGAWGFSTGLMYEPGMFSETDEVVALAQEVAAFDGVYDSHVRDPVHHFVESHTEAIEVGRRAGIPSKLGHLKSVGLQNESKIKDIIALVEARRATGHEVVSDQYPYDGAATSTLYTHPDFPERGTGILVIPDDVRAEFGGDPFDLEAALSNKAARERLREASENGIDGGFAWLKATGYSSMRIVHSEDFPDLVDTYLSELAKQRGVAPFDAVAELLLTANKPVWVTLGAIKEWEVRELLVQPWNMVASDGEYCDPSTPASHPRSTGTFPRLLGHYVRDEGLLSLEEAIRKITSLPADYHRMKDRGRIKTGLKADLVVFDPKTIIDNSTFTEPSRLATGVVHVVVNGEFVLRDSGLTGQAPGRFLRKPP